MYFTRTLYSTEICFVVWPPECFETRILLDIIGNRKVTFNFPTPSERLMSETSTLENYKVDP